MRRTLSFAALLVTLGPLTAAAGELDARSDCPALFQEADERRENAEERRAVLEYVQGSPEAIVVVHSADWDDAQRISIDGLTLAATELRPEGWVAIFELGEALERTGCALGRYVLHVDDGIAKDTHVLAILDDVVLVEHEGELRFITTRGSTPRISLVWSSPWAIRGGAGPARVPAMAPAPIRR